MIRYWISHAQSRRFISFQNTRKFGLNFVGYTTHTIFHNFTGHSRSNWCFQLLASILDSFFEFFVLRVDETDPSQFSCVSKMELFIRPFLLLFQLGIPFYLKWMQNVPYSVSKAEGATQHKKWRESPNTSCMEIALRNNPCPEVQARVAAHANIDRLCSGTSHSLVDAEARIGQFHRRSYFQPLLASSTLEEGQSVHHNLEVPCVKVVFDAEVQVLDKDIWFGLPPSSRQIRAAASWEPSASQRPHNSARRCDGQGRQESGSASSEGQETQTAEKTLRVRVGGEVKVPMRQQSRPGAGVCDPFPSHPASSSRRLHLQFPDETHLPVWRLYRFPWPSPRSSVRGSCSSGFCSWERGCRVCRQGGARVSTCLLVVCKKDQRRLEVVVDGLPLFHSAQLAIDTTLVAVRGDGRWWSWPARAHLAAVGFQTPIWAEFADGIRPEQFAWDVDREPGCLVMVGSEPPQSSRLRAPLDHDSPCPNKPCSDLKEARCRVSLTFTSPVSRIDSSVFPGTNSPTLLAPTPSILPLAISLTS